MVFGRNYSCLRGQNLRDIGLTNRKTEENDGEISNQKWDGPFHAGSSKLCVLDGAMTCLPASRQLIACQLHFKSRQPFR